MDQKEFVITVSNVTGVGRKDVAHVLATAGLVISDVLSNAVEDVSFPEMGKFKSIRRPQRKIVMPNGTEHVVGGKLVAKFAPGGRFIARVNGAV